MPWRDECISTIKTAMQTETNRQELREMSSALSGLIPWEPEEASPQPVVVVKKKKLRKKGKWGRRKT